MPCNVFINDLDAEIECTVSNFGDDNKLGEVIDSLAGRDALQIDMDRLESWAIITSMRFHQSKYWILHLR